MNKFDGKNDGRGVQDARKKISISPLDAIHAIASAFSIWQHLFIREYFLRQTPTFTNNI